MSPTMSEGGITNWKVKEGAKFAAGDVLLEIVRYGFAKLFYRAPVQYVSI